MTTTVFWVRPISIDPPALGHTSGARKVSPPVVRSPALGGSGRLSLALLLAAGFVLGSSAARADMGEWLRNESLVGVGGCESAINETTSEGARCIAGLGLSWMLEEGARFATEYGKHALGEHFQVAGNLAWSPNGNGLVGDLDAVFPFSFSADSEDDSSLFFQQGITRWRDDVGAVRNDLRQGIVQRFRISDGADADILGVSVFHLHSAEHGHHVLVSGLDYAGSWGTGSFRYFTPATNWRPARFGHEERALEGVEFGMRFDLTTTLGLHATGYRWEAEVVSAQWITGARLQVDWRPHPWFNLSAGYDRAAGGDESASFLAGLAVPFGGGTSKPPRWEGFGLASGGSPTNASDLWSPVSGVGRIELATRSASTPSVQGQGDGVQVRFLQDSVASGESVQVEVSLAEAAAQDVRVTVRLVPGSGDNPAVPGEDFVDEPVETTIRQGTMSTVVVISLLRNDQMAEVRSLKVTASIVS